MTRRLQFHKLLIAIDTSSARVFVHAKVFFSIGGQHFTGEPVQFSYMPDTVMENARDVTIKLHQRVGRYVQIHLYFALRWIMLSEISFNSELTPIRSHAHDDAGDQFVAK
uniref:Discoidin domain-containing protein n=1 Tax=Anopheles melas TaxID=34690 RepID=A0A182UCY3_9DIPT